MWSLSNDQRDVLGLGVAEHSILKTFTAGPIRSLRQHDVAGRSLLHPLDEVVAWVQRAMPWVTPAMVTELIRRAIPIQPKAGWAERQGVQS